MKAKPAKRIILSRTDSIGDVVLTLPMAGALKQHFPETEVLFLGRDYTREVVALSEFVDDFISWDEAASLNDTERINWLRNQHADAIIHVFPVEEIARLSAKAAIPLRIGTTGRLYHYRYVNKLVRFSRKKSDLHEAQLNFKLLKPFIGADVPTLKQLQDWYGFTKTIKNGVEGPLKIDQSKFNLILHPKSKGSARDWPLENYSELIDLLQESRLRIFVSGTSEEGKMMRSFLFQNQHKVTDLTGKFSLKQFIQFIQAADGLVAASTGPLHLAAALGKLAVGIYPPIRPMHPGRWAPIGKQAHYLVADKVCDDCRKSKNCHCMAEVTPQQVAKVIMDYAG